jgi:hypothetical protein
MSTPNVNRPPSQGLAIVLVDLSTRRFPVAPEPALDNVPPTWIVDDDRRYDQLWLEAAAVNDGAYAGGERSPDLVSQVPGVLRSARYVSLAAAVDQLALLRQYQRLRIAGGPRSALAETAVLLTTKNVKDDDTGRIVTVKLSDNELATKTDLSSNTIGKARRRLIWAGDITAAKIKTISMRVKPSLYSECDGGCGQTTPGGMLCGECLGDYELPRPSDDKSWSRKENSQFRAVWTIVPRDVLTEVDEGVTELRRREYFATTMRRGRVLDEFMDDILGQDRLVRRLYVAPVDDFVVTVLTS